MNEVKLLVTEKHTQKPLLEKYYFVSRDNTDFKGVAKAGLKVTLSRNYQSIQVEVGGEIPAESSAAGIGEGQTALLRVCDDILNKHRDWMVETLSNLSGK